MGKRKRQFEWWSCGHDSKRAFVAIDKPPRVTLVRICDDCARAIRIEVARVVKRR